MIRIGKAQRFIKLLAEKDVSGLRKFYQEYSNRPHIDTSEVISELAKEIINEV